MTVYTIGHSNTTLVRFLDLLTHQAIGVLIDARSQPYSRFSPQFNRPSLSTSLKQRGITYRYLGDKLGGRPKDPHYRLPDGEVDYLRLAAAAMYREGLQQLRREAARRRTAVMCSEADYRRCHRYWLITRSLIDQGVEVQHILHSGDAVRTVPDDFAAAAAQGRLL
jgi:uncharacterized protein (DUF488 family)